MSNPNQNKANRMINKALQLEQKMQNIEGGAKRGGVAPQQRYQQSQKVDWRTQTTNFGAMPGLGESSLYGGEQGDMYDDSFGTLPAPQNYRNQNTQQAPGYTPPTQQQLAAPLNSKFDDIPSGAPSGFMSLIENEFKNNPIHIPQSAQVGMSGVSDSALSALFENADKSLYNIPDEPQIPQQQQYYEQQPRVISEQSSSQQLSGGVVDYSVLNSLFKQSLDEFAKKMHKIIRSEANKAVQNLIESSDKIALIKLDENLRFLTKDKKVYEAPLKYKGVLKS